MRNQGLEYNNPGNIPVKVSHLSGEITKEQENQSPYSQRYKVFDSMEYGYRAIFLILYNYSELYGDSTIAGLINRWCSQPGREKKEGYIKAIAKRLKLPTSNCIDTLNPDTMKQIAKSITKIEQGEEPNKESINKGWEIFIKQVSSKR